MLEYKHKQIALGVTVSRDELSNQFHVRIPDPWWRKPLVALGMAQPRYRARKIEDFLYGDNSFAPDKFRGLAEIYMKPRD